MFTTTELEDTDNINMKVLTICIRDTDHKKEEYEIFKNQFLFHRKNPPDVNLNTANFLANVIGREHGVAIDILKCGIIRHLVRADLI